MGLGALGMGMGAGGQLLGGIGAFQQGQAEKKMDQYNASLDVQKSKQITAVTQLQQQKVAEAAHRHASSMEAGMSAAGIVTTEGSPLLVMAKQASESELTNLNIGYEGRVKSQQELVQAEIDKEQGRMAMQQGRMALYGAILGAAGTGFMGAAKYGGGGTPSGQAIGGADPSYVASPEFESLSGQYGTFM